MTQRRSTIIHTGKRSVSCATFKARRSGVLALTLSLIKYGVVGSLLLSERKWQHTDMQKAAHVVKEARQTVRVTVVMNSNVEIYGVLPWDRLPLLL